MACIGSRKAEMLAEEDAIEKKTKKGETVAEMLRLRRSGKSRVTSDLCMPEFSGNNCAQNCKRTFVSPTFCVSPLFKYTKIYISTDLSTLSKLCSFYCQKLFASKIGSVETLRETFLVQRLSFF